MFHQFFNSVRLGLNFFPRNIVVQNRNIICIDDENNFQFDGKTDTCYDKGKLAYFKLQIIHDQIESQNPKKVSLRFYDSIAKKKIDIDTPKISF